MAKLSISKAWDETRSILGRDGKLFAAVALAMIFLPGVVIGVVDPDQSPTAIMSGGKTTWLVLVAALIGLVGQLAMIRLALGAGTSVRDSIGHGVRRLPPYVVATLIWVLPLVLCFMLFGKSFGTPEKPSAIGLLVVFLLLIGIIFLTVRLILSSSVASAEPVGPLAILQRAWQLSKGHWWRLFAFVLIFGIAAIALLGAVGALTGIAVSLLFGAIEPMSVGALFAAVFAELASAVITTVFVVMNARLYAQLSGLSTVSVPSTGT